MPEPMPITQVLYLVAAGTAILLGMVAIVLTGVFFFLTSRLNARSNQAAGRVEECTERLTELYRRLSRDSSLFEGYSTGEQPANRVVKDFPIRSLN